MAKRRMALGMSQETLAERAEVSRNLVGLIETGQTNPTLRTMVKVAKALGVRVMDLMDGL